MKGDYTRFTFDPDKHYTGVLLQQGRVQVDADWNEQVAIQRHLEETEAIDVIGPCGAPKTGGGFQILRIADRGDDLGISTGRIYVDGILCEIGGETVAVTAIPAANQVQLQSLRVDGRDLAGNDWVELSAPDREPKVVQVQGIAGTPPIVTIAPDAAEFLTGGAMAPGMVLRRAVTYLAQPDLPGAPALDTATRTELVYLDVWRRHVTAIEDPQIREVALGGPDTAARVQTVCQVRVLTVPDGTTCATDPIAGWPPSPSGGRLTVDAVSVGDADDPCLIRPDAGYRGLENRLYRVEIHDAGGVGPGAGAATFKWSRDNGSVTFPIEEFVAGPPARMRMKRTGRDEVLALRQFDWVEVLDDAHELTDQRGAIAQITDLNQSERLLTLSPWPPAGRPFDINRHPRVRRWDQGGVTGPGTVPVAAGPIELEDGVQVAFAGGAMHAGDYWTFPARTAIGDVTGPVGAPPEGIVHHYCKLAIVTWLPRNGGIVPQVEDCRPLFPPLTHICAEDICVENSCLPNVVNLQQMFDTHCAERVLRFVSGDGQEGPPGAQLPADLVVGVEDGFGRPQAGVPVRFTVTAGNGSISTSPTGPTVPALTVTTDANGLARVRWILGPGVNPGLNTLTAALTATGRLPVTFQARGVSPAGHLPYRVLRLIGGDGQTGRPGDTLSCPLIVGVEDENGRPVERVEVVFRPSATGANGDTLTNVAPPGNQSTGSPLTVVTDANGLAQVRWTFARRPEDRDPCRRVTAQLGATPPQGAALNVIFEATSVGASFPVVEKVNWNNDQTMTVSRFLTEHLQIFFSEEMSPDTLDPSTVIVTLEPPFSATEFGVRYIGYHPIVIHGHVQYANQMCIFRPDWIEGGQDALVTLVNGWMNEQSKFPRPLTIVPPVTHGPPPGVRCRVTLKGDKILDKAGERPLDGEISGRIVTAGGGTFTELRFPSGNGVRGGDFDSWFWLVPDRQGGPLIVNGTLTVGGQPVRAGAIVVAMVRGQACVTAHVVNSRFTLSVPSADEVNGCGQDGDVVTFLAAVQQGFPGGTLRPEDLVNLAPGLPIDTIRAAVRDLQGRNLLRPAAQSIPFQRGQTRELNLTLG